MKRQQLFDALVGVSWEEETRTPFKRFIKSLSAAERAQLHESNCAYVTVLEANIESYDDEINGFSHVFDHREGMSRKREFTIFTILSVIGLGLNDLYMFVGVTFLSIGYQAMKAIATFLVTWYNYFSRRFFLEGARS